MTIRCDFTDLPADQCAHCHPPAAPPPAEHSLASRPFEARYGGRCAACDGGIREGDQICYGDDEIEHWECP